MADEPERTLTCVMTAGGRRWSPDDAAHVMDYTCDRCHARSTFRFHDRYPARCPYCGSAVVKVRGVGHG